MPTAARRACWSGAGALVTGGGKLPDGLQTAGDALVIGLTDGLVAPSGPAGLAAARNGVEVVMGKRFGRWCGNRIVSGGERLACHSREATVEAMGIGRAFEERARAMGAAVPESQPRSHEPDSKAFRRVAGPAIGGDMACCAVAAQGARVTDRAVTSNRDEETADMVTVQRELIWQGGRIP